MALEHKCNVVILGGGIGGLMTLDKLVQNGFDTYLIDNNALGTGQTIASQGIIHAGIKYLDNKELSTKLLECQDDWEKLIQEIKRTTGEDVVNSYANFMWKSRNKSQFERLVAHEQLKRVVNSGFMDATKLDKPECFKDVSSLFEINERILEIPMILEYFANKHSDRILSNQENVEIRKNNDTVTHIATDEITFNPQSVIYTAGKGNIDLTSKDRVQKRPLRMMYVIGDLPSNVFGHCIDGLLGKSLTWKDQWPTYTITTHKDENNENIWYIGGKIAEDLKAQEDPIDILGQSFPDITIHGYSILDEIVRYEPENAGNIEGSYVDIYEGNQILAFPTKLALAPEMANKVKYFVDRMSGIHPKEFPPDSPLPKRTHEIAKQPWISE